MNILDLIDTKVSAYTKTDRAIYEKLKKYPEKFVKNSYNEIVEDIDVSPAALTRFAKHVHVCATRTSWHTQPCGILH